MNYRHAYHAGNFADVLKHVVLFALLDAMGAKPKPFFCLDTHAGRGLYRLDSDAAGKTGEYLDGVARLWRAEKLPPLLQRWRQSLRAVPGNEESLCVYPGSPLQTAARLRPGDALHLCELQSDEAQALRGCLHGRAGVHVHVRDGYAALKALLPPTPRRGLVLIDPPYEAQRAEFDQIRRALDTGFARWPEGIYAVWYPLKQRAHVQPFLRWAARAPMRQTLCVELVPYSGDSPLRLNGSGMVIFNAPWTLDATLREPLSVLARELALDGPAQTRLTWLRTQGS